MKKAAKTVAWDALADEKLKSSGLNRKDAEQLGISFVDRAQTAGLGPKFKALKSLRLDYFDHHGKPLSDWPKGKPFFRVRYLEEAQGLDALTKKQPRYAQVLGTAPVAYLPRSINWAALVDDTSKPVIVTEGEFKAAKACKEGFPTIGLGGVYNWRSLKAGMPWLPSLEPFSWVRRSVYLCFDSDVRTNPMVQAALKELADAFQHRGAMVFFTSLPELKEVKKVGLDDFFVHSGPTAREQFEGVLHMSEPLGLAKPLWELNERYLYVRDPGLVFNVVTHARVSPSAFKEHTESTKLAYEGVPKGEDVEYSQVASSAAWLKWPHRSEASKLTYAPGKPTRDEQGAYNIWSGWGVEPKKGDVTPFLNLLKHLFKGAEHGAMEWFLKWCAYPMQYPGTKLYTASVFHGVRHGTGKSFVGYILGRIYGDGVKTKAQNFTEVSQMDIHNHFNEWAAGKQLVLGDDVTGPNKRADADFLKKLITQREMRINAKYLPTYTIPDCVNYFFTANHPDAFFLEDDDRRFFIHEVISGPLEEEFYRELELWLDTTGAAALFHYFLNLDVGTFNPSAPAMRTHAKDRMTSNTQSDLASWVRTLKGQPDQVLRVGEMLLGKDLFTAQELLELYDPERRTGTTANGLGRELSRAGVRQINDGDMVRIASGKLERLYAVRNPDHWLDMPTPGSAAAKHLSSWFNKMAEPEKKRSKY